MNEESILNRLCDLLMREDAMEMHWLVKSGQMSKDELFGIEPSLDELSGEGVGRKTGGVVGGLNGKVGLGGKKSQGGGSSSLHGAQAAQCPVCRQFVSGSRFAPHLERCIMGKKRVERSHYSSLDDGIHSKSRKVPFVDPHPDSAIVRIKVRRDNGAPLAITQRREGVSKGEWEQAVAAAEGGD